jgi:hypothetical protein
VIDKEILPMLVFLLTLLQEIEIVPEIHMHANPIDGRRIWEAIKPSFSAGKQVS